MMWLNIHLLFLSYYLFWVYKVHSISFGSHAGQPARALALFRVPLVAVVIAVTIDVMMQYDRTLPSDFSGLLVASFAVLFGWVFSWAFCYGEMLDKIEQRLVPMSVRPKLVRPLTSGLTALSPVLLILVIGVAMQLGWHPPGDGLPDWIAFGWHLSLLFFVFLLFENEPEYDFAAASCGSCDQRCSCRLDR